jgi:hypothetical protein
LGCFDSDNSLGYPDYFGVKGTCTDSSGTYEDYCSDEDSGLGINLVELFCPLCQTNPTQGCAGQGYTYCKDGACVNVTCPGDPLQDRIFDEYQFPVDIIHDPQLSVFGQSFVQPSTTHVISMTMCGQGIGRYSAEILQGENINGAVIGTPVTVYPVAVSGDCAIADGGFIKFIFDPPLGLTGGQTYTLKVTQDQCTTPYDPCNIVGSSLNSYPEGRAYLGGIFSNNVDFLFMKTVCDSCHGVSCPSGQTCVAGTCETINWYLGNQGEDCNQVCSSHGGFKKYVSGGGPDKCDIIEQLLGDPNACSSCNPSSSWNYPPLFRVSTSECQYKRYHEVLIQPWASSSDYRRLCPCNN